MVKRIAERRPDTSRASWNDSWEKNEVYLNNISKYDLDGQESQVGTLFMLLGVTDGFPP